MIFRCRSFHNLFLLLESKDQNLATKLGINNSPHFPPLMFFSSRGTNYEYMTGKISSFWGYYFLIKMCHQRMMSVSGVIPEIIFINSKVLSPPTYEIHIQSAPVILCVMPHLMASPTFSCTSSSSEDRSNMI